MNYSNIIFFIFTFMPFYALDAAAPKPSSCDATELNIDQLKSLNQECRKLIKPEVISDFTHRALDAQIAWNTLQATIMFGELNKLGLKPYYPVDYKLEECSNKSQRLIDSIRNSVQESPIHLLNYFITSAQINEHEAIKLRIELKLIRDQLQEKDILINNMLQEMRSRHTPSTEEEGEGETNQPGAITEWHAAFK